MKTTLILALIAGAVLRSDAQTACGDDVEESCSGGLLIAFTGFSGGEEDPTMEQICPVVETFTTCESDVGCDIDLSTLGMDAEAKANLVLGCECGSCLTGLLGAMPMGRRALSASSPWGGRQLQEGGPEDIAAICDALDGWAQCQEDAGVDCSPLMEGDGEDEGEDEDDMSMDDIATICAAVADIDLDDIDVDCVSTCPDDEEEPTCAQADTFFGTGGCGETCGDATKMFLAASLGCDASAFANIDVDLDSDTVKDVVVEDVVVEIEMVLTFEEELSDDDQTDACAALVTSIADVDASVNENYITCDMSLQSRRSRHLLSFVYDTDMTITIPANVVAAAGGVATVAVLQATIADPVALEASVTASVAEIGGGAEVSGIETEVSGVDDDVDVDNSSSLNGASLFVVFGAMLVARF